MSSQSKQKIRRWEVFKDNVKDMDTNKNLQPKIESKKNQNSHKNEISNDPLRPNCIFFYQLGNVI